LNLIGKSHTLPKGEKLTFLLSSKGIDGNALMRSQSASTSKSWSTAGVRLEDILQKVRQSCPITASQIEMQAAFGLRVSESIQIEPEISDMGDRLSVYRGTKGGKTRVVQFDLDPQMNIWQRDVLERAKLHARKHPKRRLAVGNITLIKARNHYYNVIRKVGITRNELGVTSHGLRHEFAARKYEQLTGMRPQVEATMPSSMYRAHEQEDHLARLDISQQLGHWRKDVTSAYIGSTTTLSRDSRKRIENSLALIESNPQVLTCLREQGVSRMWLCGKSAWGLPLSLHEKLNLSIQIENAKTMEQLEEKVNALMVRLGAVINRGVSLSMHLGTGQPQDALEISLGKGA
jgi:hypothetical protein